MRRRSYKIKLAPARVAELAGKIVEEHGQLLAKGYRLCGSSGFWRTKARGVTARMVYRSADRSMTITHIVRGIDV